MRPFTKATTPKADRLGVVYTPDEIVRFMIDSTDYLLQKHFGKQLQDKNVEILDPATGTGTFICDIIDHIAKDKLPYKYKHELHANEVEILPYYIANLNIEFTYKQKMEQYAEFTNLCFVDTLDNMGFEYKDKQGDIFSVTDENSARINQQNTRKISVVIGNPPYNAKQQNYNFQNSNRAYPEIDARIQDTYIKQGSAQNQIVIYDMYTRFLRWASDRLDKNGVVAFVSNNSFLEGHAFDGFRKVISKEFNTIYVINMKGNAHSSGETRRRQGGNVFNDQIRVGVAIYFLVRKFGEKGFRIHYNEVPDYTTAQEKLTYLHENRVVKLKFEQIIPDKKYNWINKSENDFDELIPLMDKNVKAGIHEKAIFGLFTRGVASLRDEWTYDFSLDTLKEKMKYFVTVYQNTLKDEAYPHKMEIKWDRELNNYLRRKISKGFNKEQITDSLYKPFVKMNFYFDQHFNGMTYQWFNIYRWNQSNITISINVGSTEFVTLVSDFIVCQGTLLVGGGSTQCLPLYRFTGNDDRLENITGWALSQFQKHYQDKAINRLDIFHYVYAVLHNPAYREKYAQNLKREFPRIPFYEDFWQWANWGKQLMELHLNYETAQPFPLVREDKSLPKDPLNPPVTRLIARKRDRLDRSRFDHYAAGRADRGMGLPAGDIFGAGMDIGALQGKDT